MSDAAYVGAPDSLAPTESPNPCCNLVAPICGATHRFKSMGLVLSSRIPVVRFPDGALWLYSPVPLIEALKSGLDRLGPVR